ncbi:hypothetical protein Goe21_00830 [Bacillus phage vB_BsuM-Goe21]|nr:hypothetical protein Goe21_00830 [Bacillus phage vB_BsuM-Goe21]
MKYGVLVYKCRRCNKEDKSTHVPDGLTALIGLINDKPLPWNGIPIEKTSICNCKDGNLGVSDLIGFEFEKSE